MKNDIVLPDQSKELPLSDKLRIIHCSKDDLESCGVCLPCQAANEIERLYAENVTMHNIISEQNRLNRMRNITGMQMTVQDEITALLREYNPIKGRLDWSDIMNNAADEIEDLRTQNIELRIENNAISKELEVYKMWATSVAEKEAHGG